VLTIASDIHSSSEKYIKIYPNPAKDILHINFSDISNKIISITDISGKLLFEKLNNSQKETIDIVSIP